MDKTIRKICEMLQSPDGMRRCAAAMVLTELTPKDAAVIRALGDALKDGSSQLLTRYVLEAFEAMGTRAVVPHVLPLLDAEDTETKLRAAGILARVGGDIVEELRRRFEEADSRQKHVFVDILARIHSRGSMQIILDSLFDPDFELVKEACQAVRRHIADTTPKDRLALHKQVVKFMKTARVKKNERVLTSCLLLIGYLGAPEARAILLKHTGRRTPSFIRRNALFALKGLEFTGAAVNQVARQMLKYLAEPDFPNIGQHALDIIERLLLPASYIAQWRKLLNSKHPSVRAFAARKLAAYDKTPVNRLLLRLLDHADRQIGEIAAGALARHKGAGELLLQALARERKAEAAWRLAKILKPHSETIDKKTAKKFAALTTRDLEAGNPRHEALLYFLRNIDSKLADSVWRDVGLKLRKARKWDKAAACLRQLAHPEGFDNEIRYDLSVCNLKLSPKELAGNLRAGDVALRGFQTLLQDKKFKLFERLKKDKALEPIDLFYVGFHFSESTGTEGQFGRNLLDYVARRWPKSKEAKAARNKLKVAEQSSANIASETSQRA
jgi:HEAT repeat protein